MEQKNDEYQYLFVFDNWIPEKALASFKQEYYNGELYNFRLIVKPYNGENQIESRHFLQLQNEGLLIGLLRLYLDKYGVPLERNTLISDIKDYIWINGNREIVISLENDFVNVLYSDLNAIKQIENEEKEKREKMAIETKSDI